MIIAVLGGRFDPPHLGHLLVAKQVLEKMRNIDEVWLIPANTHPWKTIEAKATDRLKMTKLLATGKIKACGIDIKRGGQTYTIDTVRLLKKDKKNHYLWLCGADTIAEFSRWKDYQKLKKLIPFIVFPRGNFPIKKIPQGFKVVKNKNLLVTNYSSSLIRKRVRKELPITGLVPEKVAEYIRKHNLYRI